MAFHVLPVVAHARAAPPAGVGRRRPVPALGGSRRRPGARTRAGCSRPLTAHAAQPEAAHGEAAARSARREHLGRARTHRQLRRFSSADSTTSCAQPIAAHLASALDGRSGTIWSTPRRRARERVGAARRNRSQARRRCPSEIETLPARGEKKSPPRGADPRAGGEAERQRLIEQTRREIDVQLRIAQARAHRARRRSRRRRRRASASSRGSRPTIRCVSSIATSPR